MGDCRIPRTAMYRQSGKCRLGQDISARSGGETGEQRRPILRLVLAGLALVHDLVLIVVHDRPPCIATYTAPIACFDSITATEIIVDTHISQPLAKRKSC